MKKLISYVFPIFNESGNIDLLFETLSNLLQGYDIYNYEIIFVNDGSKDDSLMKLIKIQELDSRVIILDFSRNFGHQIAVTAGIDYAQGDAIIIMDSDMQDPPAISFKLLEKWENGFDVVYAQRNSRKDTLFKRITAKAFYKLLHTLSDINIPQNTGDFRLIDRKIANELMKFKEHNRFLRGLISFIGFRQTAVQFDRDARHSGNTSYPLKKMIKFAQDGILSFSSAPLKLISRIGYLLSGVSVIGIIYALLMYIFDQQRTVPGWTFIVISIFLIGGIQLVMLGVLGEYIGRIYTESQGRPLYMIQNIYKKS